MSEWYNSQKKPSSNFRKLLQERLDKANPRCAELAGEEKKRLAKLEAITERLKPLRKEHGFTTGMLKGTLAKGRAKK